MTIEQERDRLREAIVDIIDNSLSGYDRGKTHYGYSINGEQAYLISADQMQELVWCRDALASSQAEPERGPEVKDLINEIQEIKWLIDEGPAHVKFTEAQTRLTKIKEVLSTAGMEDSQGPAKERVALT